MVRVLDLSWGIAGGRCWVRTNVGLADGFTGGSLAGLRNAIHLHEHPSSPHPAHALNHSSTEIRSVGPAMSGCHRAVSSVVPDGPQGASAKAYAEASPTTNLTLPAPR